MPDCHRGHCTQLIKKGEHEETPGFQNFAVFCPLCIVRGRVYRTLSKALHGGGSRYWVGIIATVEVQSALWVCRLGAGGNTIWLCFTTAGLFTFLERWVYIDVDRMSFFKRCAITSFENGLPTLDWY